MDLKNIGYETKKIFQRFRKRFFHEKSREGNAITCDPYTAKFPNALACYHKQNSYPKLGNRKYYSDVELMKTFKEFRMLVEDIAQLPPVIIFKRGAIRTSPRGLVAEYHSAELNQTIIFPNTFSKGHKRKDTATTYNWTRPHKSH